MNKKIETTAFIKSKPGRSEELKAAILDLIEETLKESECEIFKVFQSHEDPEEFILWEVFATPSALQEHMEKSYTKKYFSLNLAETTSAIHHAELTR